VPLFTLAPAPLLLYAFRYRDELTGKRTKARYAPSATAVRRAKRI
jgi:hypothetical protein